MSIAQKILLSLVGIACLLLLGGLGGYWIYREWSDTSANLSQRQQMLMLRLTDGRIANCPSISPDGKFVAFVENFGTGTGSLYLHQTDTNTIVELLEPGERVYGCTNFSPDGSLVYYIVINKKNPQGILYRIPVLGGKPTSVVSNIDTCFALSPNGEQVAFIRRDPEKGVNSLWIADLKSGREKLLLTPDPDLYEFINMLAWSPNDQTIAVVGRKNSENSESRYSIFEVDKNSAKISSLIAENFFEIGKISWTNDGSNLVFIGRKAGADNELYLMDADVGDIRRITNDLESYGNYGLGITADSKTLVANTFNITSEIWKIPADGDTKNAVRVTTGKTDGRFGLSTLNDEHIVFIAQTGKGAEIQTVRSDGTERKILTDDSHSQREVIASPDRRYLVFAGDQTGKYKIYRMNAEDNSEITQLTFGETSDRRPDISPDGKWIVYSASDGNMETLWKVPITGGKSIQLTEYESLSPVFSPDGKTIACIIPSRRIIESGAIAIIPAEGGSPLKTFQILPFSWDPKTIRWKPDGTALIFTKNKANLWQQKIDGGEPTRLTDFSGKDIRTFTYSKDGRELLIARGENFVDVVLIKNFR